LPAPISKAQIVSNTACLFDQDCGEADPHCRDPAPLTLLTGIDRLMVLDQKFVRKIFYELQLKQRPF
jgi:hypothetical protein